MLKFKVNEISNKPFYIKENKEKYNLKGIEIFKNYLIYKKINDTIFLY